MASSFGETPNGADWCIKALHPADPLVEVRGIPDESAVPSVFLNYQAVQTIKPFSGATGTWECDLQLIPNPVTFLAGYVTDSTGLTNVQVLNAQLTGSDSVSKTIALTQMASRWRLAYAGVTIYQDGPDLSNQGTVCVCQKPLAMLRQNYAGGALDTANIPAIPTIQCGLSHLVKYLPDDYPDYASSQGMPNAYFGQSKDGVYVPLKLTRTHQQWRSVSDLVYFAQSASYATGGPFYLQLEPVIGQWGGNEGFFPFFDAQDFTTQSGSFSCPRPAGMPLPDFCNDVVADIGFRNLSVNTNLSMYFRFGFELQVPPQSTMAPELRLSPVYDPLAVSTYFKVARELKDAYPADFNDLGKMWDMISTGLKHVTKSGILNVIPGFGPALQLAAQGVTTAGDSIRGLARASPERRGNTVSRAQVDRLVQQSRNRGPPRTRPTRTPRQPAPQRGPRTISIDLSGPSPARRKRL